MQELVEPFITTHAIKRFRERIQHYPDDTTALAEILRCLATVKPKHFQKSKIRKRTYYIPTDRCLMIVNRGKIVTIIPKR